MSKLSTLRKKYKQPVYDMGNDWFVVNGYQVTVIDQHGIERFKGTRKEALIKFGKFIEQELWNSQQEYMNG